MVKRRIAEFSSMVLIGDGMPATSVPTRHSLLWRAGLNPWNKLMQGPAVRPDVVRALRGAEAGVGLWLARRLYPRV